METILKKALGKRNESRPPVWFMRQAGRYHNHYQSIRANASFLEACKKPELACEVTMGPINDFDFDAAILFSDILFPLEAMGIPLDFNPGPQLGFLLREDSDLGRLHIGQANDLAFQYDALSMIRKELPTEKGLIGFVGAPLTLFYFAVEGSHKQSLESARSGLIDGRFEKFCEFLLPLLIDNMCLQAKAPIDAMALFDTCAGDLSSDQYKQIVVPVLEKVMSSFKQKHPDVDIIYYSKGTGDDHWQCLKDLPISCLGVDWTHDLTKVLERYGDQWAIQGNFDQTLLRDTPTNQFPDVVRSYFKPLENMPRHLLRGWVCGLGHGVLPQTPEENVRAFIQIQKEVFGE